MQVDRRSADHVVCARADGNRIAGDVEVEIPAEPIDAREASTDSFGVEVGEVEVDARVLGLGHLGGDRQRDVVPRGQLGEVMIGRHEPLAVTVAEIGTFPAQGFRQQVTSRASQVEDGRVELHEFHVPQLGAGTVSHGVTVGRGDRRVGRFPEELAGSARGQNDRSGPDQSPAPLSIPDQHATASALVGQEVDREAVGPQPDIGPGPDALDDRAHHFAAGLVAEGVDDPSVRMAPFAAEGDMAVDLVEVSAPFDQLADPDGCLADHHLDDLLVAEPLARGEGVGDVVVESILWVEDSRDSPLGVLAVALAHLILGHDQDAIPIGDSQRSAEARNSSANDEDIGEVVWQLPGIEPHKVAARHQNRMRCVHGVTAVESRRRRPDRVIHVPRDGSITD